MNIPNGFTITAWTKADVLYINGGHEVDGHNVNLLQYEQVAKLEDIEPSINEFIKLLIEKLP